MLEISVADLKSRIEQDNPWWRSGKQYLSLVADYPKRFYFEEFSELATQEHVRRALILMGPRRVGKTVMLFQLIDKLIQNGFETSNIMYVSIDAPIYNNMPLEKFINFFSDYARTSDKKFFILFDEIQYLKNWEVHLKDLVDTYRNIRFVASGSAAAALRLKSQESGAGRFTDFKLPPLTFAEFIEFTHPDEVLFNEIKFVKDGVERKIYSAIDIAKVNILFIEYLNYGGYPEAAREIRVRERASQFVRNDIIDKVLLKDLPALYGISNIQELNKLFSYLAYNTGQELSLQAISQKSGVTKPTISKYIEYLESAFLITKISRVDGSARRFERETTFKVYLNNPSMRAAIFSPVDIENDVLIGHLAESAIFSQWCHSPYIHNLHYARWNHKGKTKEVDILYLSGADHSPTWAMEIKWSDRVVDRYQGELDGLLEIATKPTIQALGFTTKSKSGTIMAGDKKVTYLPCASYCYTVGSNTSRMAQVFRD
jgi:predicted AAA+ superfamily ATPase